MTGVARARLDLCVCVLRVPRPALARALAELGPLTLAGAEQDAPICIELWDVREGRVSLPGLPQERLYEAGAMVMGAAYGAWLGPLGSFAMGLAGRRAGAALSEAATRTLGRYRELLVGVPEVSVAGAGPCYFVAGMRTDSPFASSVDRLLGYGFDKRPATFGGALASGLWVRDAPGETLLYARIDGAPARGALDFERVRAWLDRPLLAGTRGRLARSELRRAYEGPSTVAAKLGSMQLGALHPWLPRGEHRATLFRARDVAVELGLPTPEEPRHG